MADKRDTLNYASPPPLKRPPMYSLVLSVLAAIFLMTLGGALGFAVVAMAFARLWKGDQTVELWAIFVFAPIAAIFFGALATVAALRGKSPVGMKWARLAAMLSRVYCAGEQKRGRSAE